MLLFMDSCGDHLTAAQMPWKWDVCTSAIQVSASGYNGSKGLTSDTTPYTAPKLVKRVTPSPSNRIFKGFRIYTPPGSLPLGGFAFFPFCSWHVSSSAFSFSTKQLSANLETDGRLSFVRGNYNGTPIAGTTTSAPVLVNDAWTFIEYDITVSPTAGAIHVRVDNTTVLFATGLNTQALGAGVNGLEFAFGAGFIIDDVYVSDPSGTSHNWFFGKGFHVLVNPMSADASVQWTPATGTNVSRINDTTPDGSRNSTAVVGRTDLFTPTPLDVSVTTIHAVQSNLIGHKPSSLYNPTVSDLALVDGVTYAAAGHALTLDQKDHRTVRGLDPTGAPWTRAVYNASRRGYQRLT